MIEGDRFEGCFYFRLECGCQLCVGIGFEKLRGGTVSTREDFQCIGEAHLLDGIFENGEGFCCSEFGTLVHCGDGFIEFLTNGGIEQRVVANFLFEGLNFRWQQDAIDCILRKPSSHLKALCSGGRAVDEGFFEAGCGFGLTQCGVGQFVYIWIGDLNVIEIDV